jgi:hypothetical protein
LGSQRVRLSMQEAWSGCWRGRKVGVVGPFHLTKGRDVMWGIFEEVPS